ncbi:MAG TPA: hypothetical protein VIV60_26355, partial [Polyangiaceae bacterium]
MIQREPDLRDSICYKPGQVPSHGNGECDTREPENCPTYELWIKSFSNLTTFSAKDTTPGAEPSGFEVLGPTNNPSKPEDQESAPAIAPTAADAFIDHPTDSWVQTCLPDNLRETAYRLPADCADVAIILRHVWLSAHHRTEQLGSWTIGDKAGRANTSQVGNVTRDIGSINVANMLNPYLGSDGKPLRTYAELSKRLHPGDVLVWEHHENGIARGRTGGHTQTIFAVDRDEGGEIRELHLLQGNQPINEDRATAIREDIGKTAPSESGLRDAPGRRIELDTMSGVDLKDRQLPNSKVGAQPGAVRMIWMWSDSAQTTLVAAGPPAASRRPARPSQKKPPSVADWFPGLKRASTEGLQAPFESALLELRGNIEGGQTGLDEIAQSLGTVVGERLFKLAKDAKDLGDELLYRPLIRMRAVIAALAEPNPEPKQGGAQPTSELQRVFGIVDDAFNLAARGASSLSFARKVPKGKKLVRVLVTGFDPFNPASAVAEGTINPSGAAALALDGDSVVSGKVVAAVEGVVLPVSFKEFEAGIVERIVRPLARDRGVDAVITVSLDESLASMDPVRIERFVVGVHEDQGSLGPVAAAPFSAVGPLIIETPAPVEEIASETARPATGKQSAIQKPTIGTAVEFKFASDRVANEALKALTLPPQNSQVV